MKPTGGDRAHHGARTTQGGGALKAVLALVIGVLVAGLIGAASLGYWGYRQAARPGPHSEDVVVLLESGLSLPAIATRLEQAGVVRDRRIFMAVVRLRDRAAALKAGEYRIAAGSSMLGIIDQIVEGKSILHFFTVPEGLTTAQILRLLEADETLIGEISLAPPEGALLPETYGFTRGRSRDAMIAEMLQAQSSYLDAVWPRRAPELPISTREEALILASIVEKETAVPSERPRIAAVFVNRLRKGMRLESDPTIIYGLTGGEPLGRGLRVSEIKRETPYNTYRIRGLPPTPIANPGKEAIAAVLNPAETDDLFFVADGAGGHAFASTLEAHNRNVAEWRRIERDRAAAAGGTDR